MARGFGSTLGGGTTDRIVTSLTAHATQRTYAIWLYRNGNGGSGLGRIFDKNNGTATEVLYYNGGAQYEYQRSFSGGTAVWNITAPGTGAWVHLAFTYDSSAGSNVPVFYINGSSVSVGGSGATGTAVTTASGYTLGNRQVDSARVWDGMLAEFAVYDGSLAAADISSLAKGAPPALIRPDLLAHYEPMARQNVAPLGGAGTITGTAAQVHPRVLRRRPTTWAQSAAAGGGGGFQTAWARNANTVLVGGRLAA